MGNSDKTLTLLREFFAEGVQSGHRIMNMTKTVMVELKGDIYIDELKGKKVEDKGIEKVGTTMDFISSSKLHLPNLSAIFNILQEHGALSVTIGLTDKEDYPIILESKDMTFYIAPNVTDNNRDNTNKIGGEIDGQESEKERGTIPRFSRPKRRSLRRRTD